MLDTADFAIGAEPSNANTGVSYSIDASTVVTNNDTATLSFSLKSNCTGPLIASELDVTLRFYQNGIMRALIEEPESTRFRIS